MRTRQSYKRTLLASAIAATLAAGTGIPSVSWSQSADATLRGKAAANTDVVVKNIATGVTRRTKSAEDGSYTIPGLQPGTYRVDGGPGTETTVTLTVASVATLDLLAAGNEVTGSLDEITVKSKRIAETRTSEVGQTVSLQQIQTVPQLTRNFLEFADTVPGMIFTSDASGHTSLRGGAQNTNSVNVYIDGVGQKNYVKEGGVSGQFETQGNPFPQLAIGEYKVITSNYKAEYDQVSSAAIVAETKYGTNEFHGEAYGQYTHDSWRAETPAERAAGLKTPSNVKEFGASLGGPIIQDMLHFFVTYEGKRFVTPVTVRPGIDFLNGVDVTTLLPADAVAQLGPATQPFKEDQYFGKIDYEPTERDRLEFTAKERSESQTDNIGVTQAKSASIFTLNDETRFSLRWQHSADHWFNDVLIQHEDSFSNPTAINFGNGIVYASQATNRNILETAAAGPGSVQDKGQRGPAIQDDLTLSDLHWFGDHTLKMGAKYKRVDLTAADSENINPQFFYNVQPGTGTDAIPYKADFTNPVPGLDSTAHSRDHQFGTYFQDDWAQNEHLTWFLGMRWDYERNMGYLDYVTPANVVAAFNAQDPNAPAGQTYAQTLAKGGVNINDFISNGHNRKPDKSEFQPRLGFALDINADQKHVVFGGYGRSYDRDLYDYLQVEVTKAALPTYEVWFDDPGIPGTAPGACLGGSTPCFPWNPSYLNGLSNLQGLVASSSAGSEVDMLNNHLHTPYSDQFSIGMRNTVGEWNTSAAITRVISKNGFVFTLGNRYPNGAFWMNGGQPWGNGVPGFGSLIIGTNGIQTKTTQVLLSAERPYTNESPWGAVFSYTFSDATQNRSITQHYAFDQENISQYPFIRSDAVPRSRFVASGSAGLPWGFVVASKLTLATPIPENDIASFGGTATYPNGANNIPAAGTPKNFFGEHSLDFQITKNFNIAGHATIYARLDVLNIFNWYDYAGYIANWGANGIANSHPVTFDYKGNINGTPRALKVMIGGKF
jgi:outer membrane receptor for ferrienterochelin and colicin